MRRSEVVIIGGSQAGLSMSYELSRLGIPHLVLERARPGVRWRTERWETLKLLTPNWQSCLPGYSPKAGQPSGFTTAREFASLLEHYARSFDAPLLNGTTVERVRVRETEGREDRFEIDTTRGSFLSKSVVVATGQCARAWVPKVARSVAPETHQLHSQSYRSVSSVRPGGVLVVGASATGVQLARELREAGREVTLAVGPHTRMPRRYRGRDIMVWMEFAGITRDRPHLDAAVRHFPSLQLSGSHAAANLDLLGLRDLGVRLVGSLGDAQGDRLFFNDDLKAALRESQERMHRTLDRIDDTISSLGWDHLVPPPDRPAPFSVPHAPSSFSMQAQGINTVLFATGYRADLPFLPACAKTSDGEPKHVAGESPIDGLFFLGMNFMTHRFSSTISGAARDARRLATILDARRKEESHAA